MNLHTDDYHLISDKSNDDCDTIRAYKNEIDYVKNEIYRVLEQGCEGEYNIKSEYIQFLIVFAKSRVSYLQLIIEKKLSGQILGAKKQKNFDELLITNIIEASKELIESDANVFFKKMIEERYMGDVEDFGDIYLEFLGDKKNLKEYSKFILSEMLFFMKPYLHLLSKNKLITFDIKKYNFEAWYILKRDFCKNFVLNVLKDKYTIFFNQQKSQFLELFPLHKSIVHSVFSSRGKNNIFENVSDEITHYMIWNIFVEFDGEDSTHINENNDVVLEKNGVLTIAPYIFTMYIGIHIMLRVDHGIVKAVIQTHVYDTIQEEIVGKQQRIINAQTTAQYKGQGNQKEKGIPADKNVAAAVVKAHYPQYFINTINNYTSNTLLIRILCNYYKNNKKVSIDDLLELCKKEIEEGGKEYYDFIALEQCFRKYNLIEECVQGEQMTNQFIESKTQNTSQNNYPKTQKKHENMVMDVLSKKRKCDEISADMIISMLEEVGYTIYNQETFAKQLICVMQSQYKETIINRLCLHYLYSDMYRREKHEFQKQQGVKSFRLKLGNNTGFRIFFLDNEVHMIGTHDEYEKYMKNL